MNRDWPLMQCPKCGQRWWFHQCLPAIKYPGMVRCRDCLVECEKVKCVG